MTQTTQSRTLEQRAESKNLFALAERDEMLDCVDVGAGAEETEYRISLAPRPSFCRRLSFRTRALHAIYHTA